MESKQIVNEFNEIFGNLKDDLPDELAVQASTVILQELGKYNRVKTLTEVRLGNNGEPATDKQKAALKKFGIEFRNGITKQEAYQLISEAIEESNNNRR